MAHKIRKHSSNYPEGQSAETEEAAYALSQQKKVETEMIQASKQILKNGKRMILEYKYNYQ